MEYIFGNFDATNLHTIAAWLILIYGSLSISMVIDLVAGIRKAIAAGVATTSTGLKKTATKAGQYFLPLLCLSCVDIMASLFVSFPPFSMLFAAFCIICEFKSIFENTHTKQQIREASNTMNVILQNKDDLAKILVDVLNEMKDNANKQGTTKENNA